MKNWNTDKIIGAGLILVLLFLIVGSILTLLFTGKLLDIGVVATIATGLIGYMKGSSEKSEKKDGEKND